jgi:hypothetical protein
LAETVKTNAPALQHFLAHADWSVGALRSVQLALTPLHWRATTCASS